MSTQACFYHPANKITSMCLHSSCIMPLCCQCVQIHRKQYPQGDHISRIVPFKETKNIAINALQEQMNRIQEEKKDFICKFYRFKYEVKSAVQKGLDQIQNRLKERQFDYDSIIQKIKLKTTNIQGESLKELIAHYQVGNVFMEQKNSFSFNIVKSQLDKTINNFINIQQMQKKVKENSLWESALIETTAHQKQKVVITPMKVETDLICSTKRKSRQGIFVSSSPNNSARFNRTSASHQKNKQNTEQKMKQSLHFSALRQNNQVIRCNSQPKFKPEQQKRLETSNSTKSLFPSRVVIYKNNQSSKKLTLSRRSQAKSEQKSEKNVKNDKNVINRNDLTANSISRLIIKKDMSNQQCLNPQQMRELIMKKRQMQVKIQQISPIKMVTTQKIRF